MLNIHTVFSQETTEVTIPSDLNGVFKHACPIQQHCTYSIQVETLNLPTRVTDVIEVPDCVEGLCSCHYAEHLPALLNTSAIIKITTNQLIVSWTLGTFNKTEMPENVNLKAIYLGYGIFRLTVRIASKIQKFLQIAASDVEQTTILPGVVSTPV